MTLEIAFLDVGNADSIVILPPEASAVVVDVPKPRRVHEWLENRGRTTIDCLYFTHNHRDHLPSLSVLKTFIARWLEKGVIKLLYLPLGAIGNIQASTGGDSKREARLKDAIDRLLLWEEEKAFEIIGAVRGSTADHFGKVVIHILHPRYTFSELNPNRANETSLVLRVEYGEFSTLLLADIEQTGLTKLLRLCSDDELQCLIVKIPHHGAWQQPNGSDIQSLLERANAELAVLSVGSRNQHGHVVPQLFQELLRLKKDDDKRLENFVCTEVTRTCAISALKRIEMGKSGLPASQPCAGDIVIVAQPSGKWEMKNREEHIQHLESIPYAACCGRTDLSD
ncbi:MAG: hypothetical protein SVT56_08745 [Chloroflexota bacterium]|nr:hypothetical protein [Chloroflexota bacterium]